MRNIRISDITMKVSPEAGGFPLSFREKIELAKLLDKLGVDVIEVSRIANRRIDTLLVKSLASAIHSGVLALPLNTQDADAAEAAWNAVKEAAHPRLQVSLPVSTVQMEYLCHKKPAQIIDMIRTLTAQCAAYGCEVEFVAEDAGRSEPEFLHAAIAAAVESGAKLVTICDTAGTLLPDEFRGAVERFRQFDVFVRRSGVSAGMVVRDVERRRAPLNGFAEEFPCVKDGVVDESRRDHFRRAEESLLGIEVESEEVLLHIAHAERADVFENVAGRFDGLGVVFRREFRAAARQLESGCQFLRPDDPDARNLLCSDLSPFGIDHVPHRSERFEQSLARLDSVLAVAAAPDEKSEKVFVRNVADVH